MNKFVETISEGQSLADLRQNGPTLEAYPLANSIGWTISLAPTMKIQTNKLRPSPRCNKRVKYLQWKSLTPEMQWNYIKYDYIPDLFKTCGATKYHVYPEFNTNGDIHAHAVLYSENPEWDVRQWRRICMHHVNTIYLHRMKNPERLNYIHTLKDQKVQWVDYIIKDIGKIPLEPLILNKL